MDFHSARLYVLIRDELRYTPYGVDPKEVHGKDFSRGAFQVLKEKEVRLYGDPPRRTSRLVLEARNYQEQQGRMLRVTIAGHPSDEMTP